MCDYKKRAKILLIIFLPSPHTLVIGIIIIIIIICNGVFFIFCDRFIFYLFYANFATIANFNLLPLPLYYSFFAFNLVLWLWLLFIWQIFIFRLFLIFGFYLADIFAICLRDFIIDDYSLIFQRLNYSFGIKSYLYFYFYLRINNPKIHNQLMHFAINVRCLS